MATANTKATALDADVAVKAIRHCAEKVGMGGCRDPQSAVSVGEFTVSCEPEVSLSDMALSLVIFLRQTKPLTRGRVGSQEGQSNDRGQKWPYQGVTSTRHWRAAPPA